MRRRRLEQTLVALREAIEKSVLATTAVQPPLIELVLEVLVSRDALQAQLERAGMTAKRVKKVSKLDNSFSRWTSFIFEEFSQYLVSPDTKFF